MPVIVIDEIFDPIGNSHKHKQLPTVHWQYVGMERKYGVQTKWISSQGETSMYNTIDMHCHGTKEGKAIWKITKDNFYIDNEKPEDHISLLAIASAAPYYPFEFMATKDGEIDSIINTDKLKKRFAETKPILLQHYKGDVAIEYIEAVEKSLTDQKQLKNIVTGDIWSSLFFAPIVGEYDYETKTKEATIKFPFFGFEESLLFKGLARIDSKNESTLVVTFEGTLVLPATIEDVACISGNMEIKYYIETFTHLIRNIECIAIVTTAEGEYKIFTKGCKEIKREVVKPKEEKPKSEPVGWMAF
ncbi:MAG TPA: hypothetical protein VK705_10010 [Ferruginibacter sp.]|jgi:hypothetical protein|nr:hypothetical protein [Ferruginibacter sp.]